MDEDQTDSLSNSSESSSESEEETIQNIPDEDFFKTLSCLKSKDPRIYDSSVQFFKESVVTKDNKKSKNKETPFYLKDYEVSLMKKLADGEDIEAIEDEEPRELTYAQEQEATKQFFKNVVHDSGDSEEESSLLKKATEKSEEQKQKEEEDYVQFLKGLKSELGDKETEKELKPLKDFWNKSEMDESEQYLKDYILNKKYVAIDSSGALDNGDIDLSEDEKELEEQAEFEHNYNMRFERGENLNLKRYPRKIEGSLRRKDDSRKKKRTEVAQRKKDEKTMKHREIKKKQKDKLVEIEERIQKLKELTGNPELGFKDDEILEDFDPEKHDKKMQQLFNDDYYSKGKDEEHPVFDNEDFMDDEYLDEYNDNINMDCDADINQLKEKKLTRSQKKKLNKKKGFQDIMDIAKPSFDPNVHNSFKKYFDEYYSLDCEDFIDDIPCKFKYREVVPNDFGLSVEEILMADDGELNRWASVKKICKRLPDHVERNEVKIYRKKGEDENLKRKILNSLYEQPEENEAQETVNTDSFDANINYKKKKGQMKIGNTENLDVTDKLIRPINSATKSNPTEGIIASSSKTEVVNDCSKDVKIEDNSDVQKTELKSKVRRKRKRKCNESNVQNAVDAKTNIASCVEADNGPLMKKNKIIDIRVSEASVNAVTVIPDSNVQPNTGNAKKKRRRKKKKSTDASVNSNINVESGIVTKSTPNVLQNTQKHKKSNSFVKGKVDLLNEGPNKRLKNKLKKNEQFKKKRGNNVTDLSDDRLRAYGIKPKQFRSKIKYSKKNETS